MKAIVGYSMLGLTAAGLVAIAAIVVYEATLPAPLSFEAVNTPTSRVAPGADLLIRAETSTTVEPFECVVDTQFYLRRDGAGVAKITGTKALTSPNRFDYTFAIPADMPTGLYGARIRENYTCPGHALRTIDAPWVEFEVVSE